MRIAVTGASGFVGPWIVKHLAELGHTGIAISRRTVDALPQGWQWIPRSEALASAVPQGPVPIDWLVHLEVKHHAPNPTPADVLEFERVNIGATREWLQWCTRNAVRRFAYFSTIKAVGESEGCQDESASGNPRTAYGESKRAAEQCVRAWANAGNGRRVLILRPAVIYGPGNTANIYSMVRAVAAGRFFYVGENTNVKSLVSVRNVAAAVGFLLSRNLDGVFNLVDPESYSVRDLGGVMARMLGCKREPRTLPLFVARLLAACGDAGAKLTRRNMPITRARLQALLEPSHFTARKLKEAGFIHPQSTADGLREMTAWHSEEAGNDYEQ